MMYSNSHCGTEEQIEMINKKCQSLFKPKVTAASTI